VGIITKREGLKEAGDVVAFARACCMISQASRIVEMVSFCIMLPSESILFLSIGCRKGSQVVISLAFCKSEFVKRRFPQLKQPFRLKKRKGMLMAVFSVTAKRQ
jgi:hypothetical protein